MRENPLLSRPWLWAHLLCLEAPLVAVAWAGALLPPHDVSPPPGVFEGLAVVVWVIYLLDRSLDSFRANATPPDLRHAFYLRHRVLMLALMIPAGIGWAVWLVLRGLPHALLIEASVVAVLAALYLVIHTDAGSRTWRVAIPTTVPLLLILGLMVPLPLATQGTAVLGILALGALGLVPRLREAFRNLWPKEALAGLLFALGCVTCARSIRGLNGTALGLETVMLAVLFTSHLVLLSEQERPASERRDRRSTWLFATAINACLGGWICLQAGSLAPAGFAASTIVSLLLHGALWSTARHRSPEAFRVLADLALLLPALYGWL